MQNVSEIKTSGRHRPPIVIVAGPTASGKSHLAVALAERFNGEIVNADSMQVYQELSTLTARPSTADMARVPHHLYAMQSIAETSSAGIWLKAAVTAVDGIRDRGSLPIVCGGTGLYLKVLMEGLAPVPDVPPDMVAAAGDLYDREGAATFHARLVEIDPAAADRLPPADRQRLIRAFVVKQATGRTLDEWQATQPAGPPVDGPFLTLVLAPERQDLYARINGRFSAMVAAGALDEVAALDFSVLDGDLPALKALGVPEFRRHLEGECTLEDAIAKAQQTTRNFAKRQSTWFRHQLTADLCIEAFGDTALEPAIAALEAAFENRPW